MKRFQTVVLLLLGLLALTLPVPRCGGDADAATGAHRTTSAIVLDGTSAHASATVVVD